jgi:hypothetical protein
VQLAVIAVGSRGRRSYAPLARASLGQRARTRSAWASCDAQDDAPLRKAVQSAATCGLGVAIRGINVRTPLRDPTLTVTRVESIASAGNVDLSGFVILDSVAHSGV